MRAATGGSTGGSDQSPWGACASADRRCSKKVQRTCAATHGSARPARPPAGNLVAINPGAGAGCEGEDVDQITGLGPFEAMTVHMYFRCAAALPRTPRVRGRRACARADSRQATQTPCANSGASALSALRTAVRAAHPAPRPLGAAFTPPRHMEELASLGWNKPGFDVYLNQVDR